jgi:hypothetical protein
MIHPFACLSPGCLRALWTVSIAATLVITIVLNIVDEPLITTEAPYGIVSFELAGGAEQAQAIIGSWDERARQFAAFSLGFDFLYILAYSTLISVGCVIAATNIRTANWPLWGSGISLAWGMWLAALLDGVENLCLSLILLAGASASLWPAIARICALSKFGLLFVGLVFTFYGLAIGIVGRLKR